MTILFFCPRWGSEGLSWEHFCKKARDEGYHGVEAGLPFEPKEKEVILQALSKYDLLFLGQYYQSFEKNFSEHLANYEKHLLNLISAKPIKINAQTGKDYFSVDQNNRLFDLAEKISTHSGISIAHETHRNKTLFNAHITERILKERPHLTITADFSHWCNVSESLLEDQEEAAARACERAAHLHARVGHEQSAQVNDPRAPEWQRHVAAHLKWWDMIAGHHKKKGETMTITPEFGPAPYLPAMPYTQMPLANPWEINVYMMNLLKQRYH